MDERERLRLRVKAANSGLCAHLADGRSGADERRAASEWLAQARADYQACLRGERATTPSLD